MHICGPLDIFFSPSPLQTVHKGGQGTPVSYEAGLHFVRDAKKEIGMGNENREETCLKTWGKKITCILDLG